MIRCHFCGDGVPGVQVAVDHNWLPSFWREGDEDEVYEPVCPACTDARLLFDETLGEYVEPMIECP